MESAQHRPGSYLGRAFQNRRNDCWQSGCYVIYPNDSVKGLTGILTGRVEEYTLGSPAQPMTYETDWEWTKDQKTDQIKHQDVCTRQTVMKVGLPMFMINEWEE